MIRITKPAVNLREKLAELERPIGVNGAALMATNTPQDAFSLLGVGNRNLIINGGMVFNQRGIVGGSNNVGTNRAGGFGLDRWTVWRANDGANGAVIQEQSTDVPSGQYFKNSLKLTINGNGNPTASTSVRLLLHQMIEGNNMYQLQYGTSSARFFTFSFWVKCSVAGLYAVTFTNNNSDRGYVATYSINSASTWEYKTITVPGDTTGTWTTDNTAGLTINFDLGTNGPTTSTYNTWLSGDYRGGATTMKLNDKNGSTYFITGVQLEEGKIATPFEERSYGQELALCQRYFQRIYDPPMRGVGTGGTNGGASRLCLFFANTMRVPPTLTASGTFTFWNGAATTTGGTVAGYFKGGNDGMDLDITISGAFTQGQAVCAYCQESTSKYIDLSAEL